MFLKLIKTICALSVALLIAVTAEAYVNIYLPPSVGMPTGYGTTCNITWNAKAPQWFKPIFDSNMNPIPANFLNADGKDTIAITTLAYIDSLGGTSQANANSRIDKVQWWLWWDANSDGKADIQDAKYGSTRWKLIWQGDPNGSDPNVQDVDVTGWQQTQANPTAPSYPCGINMLAGTTGFKLQTRKVYILLLRKVDSSGNTNLMDSVGAVENWDNGDTSDTIGSNIPKDKYLSVHPTAARGIPQGAVHGEYVRP